MDRPVVRIGRGAGNDIVLQDTQASRHHCQISRQGDGFQIEDLGSTNGTFVNNERITAPWELRPGDQVRIGETTIAFQLAVPAAAVEDGLVQHWEVGPEMRPAGSQQKALKWGLGGLVAVLLVGLGFVIASLLREDQAAITLRSTNPEVTFVPTEAPVEAIVDLPSPSPESLIAVPPTDTPMGEVPTVELQATVKIEQPSPPIEPPPAPKPPEGVPTFPEELEQLPAVVAQVLGDMPPEQLPEALAAQVQSLPPEKVQEMIGALYPGVGMSELPGVVAASFPGLSEKDVQGLLEMAFPGQTMQLPEVGAVGGRIALGISGGTSEQYDLYVASAAGGQPRLLAEHASDPSFSPDGGYIVYHSSAPDKAGLRIMKLAGAGLVPSDDQALTSVASDRCPRFSPDATKILFFNIDRDTLHVINRDGTDRRSVGQGKYPDWSPDGQQIVFQGCTSGGKCGLMVANADGSNSRQITTHANDTMPRWRYGNIAFLSDRDANFEIYVINPDGTWLRRITRNPATDIAPVWDPSGVRLGYRSDRGGDPAVYATSGIGGVDFKQFSAAFNSDWTLAGMDWGR